MRLYLIKINEIEKLYYILDYYLRFANICPKLS